MEVWAVTRLLTCNIFSRNSHSINIKLFNFVKTEIKLIDKMYGVIKTISKSKSKGINTDCTKCTFSHYNLKFVFILYLIKITFFLYHLLFLFNKEIPTSLFPLFILTYLVVTFTTLTVSPYTKVLCIRTLVFCLWFSFVENEMSPIFYTCLNIMAKDNTRVFSYKYTKKSKIFKVICVNWVLCTIGSLHKNILFMSILP